ncbi:MAG: prolipoprotein diacylglyceryl transferase [Planctomycetes bacterium]|nr:prolipoprotein diacylglyceryl transferase [Planctomycetota bacterium]
MHPELFVIPIIDKSVTVWGFCLMVGFLSAVWMAMRRAARVQVDPDRILDVSFIALLAGVSGARLFYVIHYWHTDFAGRPNKLFAVLDCTEGGMEFFGGLLGAALAVALYMWLKKLPVRLFLDILAPGAMWGHALGRIGCFFNGCCFGALCLSGSGEAPKYPWAVRFPYGSSAHVQDWTERRVTVPAELIITRGTPAYLLRAATLNLPIEKIEGPRRRVEQLEKALADAKAHDGAAAEVSALTAQLTAAKEAQEAGRRKHYLDDLEWAQTFPSRVNPQRKTSISELRRLAEGCRSLPVHPVQIYSAISALLLSGFLSAVFYMRRRHGLVIGLLAVLYPISRVLEEMIRSDNPHDTVGLTISQFVSLAVFLGGAAFLWTLYRRPPEEAGGVLPKT